MAKVAVILPAAGSGRRFGGSTNKIFQPLGERPVFLRTLEVFAGREDVGQILLVVSAQDADEIRRGHRGALSACGTELVEGGATRSQSVRNALARVGAEAELVCVHDAVRPCVARAWVEAVFAAAAEYGAAILAYPIHGTIKREAGAEPGTIEETVPRAGLWEAQTPQVFRRALLQAAYDAGADATDDAELVQKLGHQVRLVPGDPRNIKITTPADLDFARAVIGSIPGR